MLAKKWAMAGYHLPFLLWTTKPFLSNIVVIWIRSRAQRRFPHVASGETAMAEHVEVLAEAKLGQEAAPPRRVDVAVASGKELVVHQGESILLVHPLGGEEAAVGGLQL